MYVSGSHRRRPGEARARSDDGSVTAFVVGLLAVFVACAGLAVDGGRVVGAHIRVGDVAENAARLAAQEITGIRSGNWQLDDRRAGAAARSLLASEGLTGTVDVGTRRVTVRATTTVQPTLLHLFGVGARQVQATRSAEPRMP